MTTKSMSPLRYPGGKSRIADYIREIILLNGCRKHYVEPFAGGAGVALDLLYDCTVDKITINDKDRAIYSFWQAATYNTEEFCNLIENTPVTTEEWKKQKKIYDDSSSVMQLGFSTFFLNRTNRSGIIDAGPIGGHNQNGNYKINARYNKDELISRIKGLGQRRQKIIITNSDAGDLIRNYIPKLEINSFIYMDPPYYEQGPNLYLNHYMHEDHASLARDILGIKQHWIVSYDNKPEVRDLYSNYSGRTFSIRYSVVNGRTGTEVMFFSDNLRIPKNMNIVRGIDSSTETSFSGSKTVHELDKNLLC